MNFTVYKVTPAGESTGAKVEPLACFNSPHDANEYAKGKDDGYGRAVTLIVIEGKVVNFFQGAKAPGDRT